MGLLLNSSPTIISLCEGGFIALLLLFLPLGGWIGDVKCGRYKIIKSSLLFLIVMSIIPILVSCVNLVLLKYPTFLLNNGARAVTAVVFLCLVVISIFGFASFLANVIPFAMDQLRDWPAKDSSLFISWYVWTIYTCLLLSLITFGAIFSESSMFRFSDNPLSFGKTASTVLVTAVVLTSFAVFVCLIMFRIILHKKQNWFNIEPGNVNPYKLVYRVTRFAFEHKIPIRRSAFTYCEDDLPSRLDLGKSKYGGPFTTEEVEDVKVFHEIMKLLLSLGPVLYLTIVDDSTLSLGIQLHEYYISPYNVSSDFKFGRIVLLYHGMLSTFVIVVTIPLYLLFCRCSRWSSLPIFWSLRRIEVGTIIMLLNMLFKLGVNVAANVRHGAGFDCMLILEENVFRVFTPVEMASALIVQQVLSGLAQMLLYISFFEFICAQSPHSMKGMLIGMAYSIKGFFGLIALILHVPFLNWKYSYLSCGFVYYSVNVVLCVISFVILVLVVKGYRYRERDEPSKERMYAEEYYSNVQKERYYDYSISTESNIS